MWKRVMNMLSVFDVLLAINAIIVLLGFRDILCGTSTGIATGRTVAVIGPCQKPPEVLL